MSEINQNQVLDFALQDIEKIDQQIAELSRRRAGMVTLVETLGGRVDPNPIGSQPSAAMTLERRYPSRQYNRKIVESALEIIGRTGHPMTAPEIHLEHPNREQVSTETLYRLLYNRTLTGSVMSLAGAFWPDGPPLPPGWDKSLIKKSSK
ncbi:hypothetical protein LJR009_002881 [Bosea sp. LjRoot9]|uniref:hypothetical protein n=1 Tax=Bosea sp. LjRoot9 TaxID=3342341 RepID=UPI003ED06713